MNNEALSPKEDKPTVKERWAGLLDMVVFAAEDYLFTRKDKDDKEEKVQANPVFRFESQERDYFGDHLIKTGKRRSASGVFLGVAAFGAASYEYGQDNAALAVGLGVVALAGVYLGYDGKVEEQQGRDIKADTYLITSRLELISKEEYLQTKTSQEV